MILQFSNKKVEVREEYLKSTISKSTQKELNSYTFKIKVKGKEKFEDFKKEMEKFKDENLNEIDENNNIIRSFNVGNWNYRFFSEFDSEETSYLCEIEIKQIENLFTDTLIIEGIESEVLKYKEEYDKYNDAIIIHATIKSTEEQREETKKAIGENEYFKVIRPGISNDVLNMRFGKTIWSKHDGYIKRNIVLVEKKYDLKDNNIKPFFWPELGNMQQMLAKNISYTEILEKVLISKGIMTQEEIQKVRQEVEENYKEVYKNYYLVEDAEEA